MYLYAFCISKRGCTKSILIKGAKNAKCYFFKNFFSTLNDKNTPTSNMLNLKNLALSYGRISFLRPYCSKVLEFFNTFFVLSLPLSRVSGFSLSLSLSLSQTQAFLTTIRSRFHLLDYHLYRESMLSNDRCYKSTSMFRKSSSKRR